MHPNEEWDLGFDMGEEEVFTTLPEMTYVARCDAIDRKESKEGGFFNLFWKMVITDGDMKNKATTAVTHLKPDTPHISFLRACAALRPDLVESFKGTKFKPSDYIGRKCLIDVKHHEYEATTKAGSAIKRTSARIEDWLPLPQAQSSKPKAEPSTVSGTTFD